MVRTVTHTLSFYPASWCCPLPFPISLGPKARGFQQADTNQYFHGVACSVYMWIPVFPGIHSGKQAHENAAAGVGISQLQALGITRGSDAGRSLLTPQCRLA